LRGQTQFYRVALMRSSRPLGQTLA
jgi:hypothetical protein